MHYFIIIFLFIISFINNSFGQIIATKSIKEIEQRVTELYKDYDPKKILIILAVENTILKPTDKTLLINETDAKTYEVPLRKVFSNLNPKKFPYMSDVGFTNYQWELIDQELLNLARFPSPIILMSRGVLGKLNNIDRLEVYKANYFKKLGIDLENSFTKNNFIIKAPSNQKNESNKDKLEGFYHGIITYNQSTITDIVIRFLVQMNYYPEVLIMVDYKKDNLSAFSLQLGSFKSSIKFIGYHYTAIDDLKIPAFGSDQKIIDFWYKYVNKINNAKRR